MVRLPAVQPASASPFVTNPIFVDTLLHVAGFLVNFTAGMNGRDACICSQADKLKVVPDIVDPSAQYGLFASVTYSDKNTTVADVHVWELSDPNRRVIASLRGARFRKVPMTSLKRALVAGSAPSHARSTAPPRDMDQLLAHQRNPPAIKEFNKPVTPARLATSPEDDILRIIAETAGLGKNAIELDVELAHLGIDSLMMWELVSRLRSVLSTDVVDTHVLATATTVRAIVDIVMARQYQGPRMREISATSSTVTLLDDEPGQRPCPPVSLPSEVEGPLDQHPDVSTLSMVKDVLSTILDIPADHLVETAGLRDLGLDSLTSIEARHAFQTRFSVKIEEERMLVCETIKDLVAAISAARSPGLPTVSSPAISQSPGTHMHPEIIRVQIAPKGSKRSPPLVLFHDGSGLIGGYTRLAPLGCDVWAVQNTNYRANHALAGVGSGSELTSMAVEYARLLSTLFRNEATYQEECILGGSL